jgi:hypothetical protein
MIERKTVSQCLTSDYCQGWNDAVDAIPKWISVFDVIPEKFKDVLACDENGNFGIVQFFDDNKPYEMRECGWTEVEVYYWMPLPKPPKED